MEWILGFLEILCQVLRISQILESFGREINVIIKLDRAIFQKSQPVPHMYLSKVIEALWVQYFSKQYLTIHRLDPESWSSFRKSQL